MIHIRIDGSTRRAASNAAVFRDRFRNLFPRLKPVTASAERAYKGNPR
jgi:hypothetical protein